MKARTIASGIAVLVTAGSFACWWWFRHPEAGPQPAAATPPAPVAPAPRRIILSPQVVALLDRENVSFAGRQAIRATLGNKLTDADKSALLDSIGNRPLNGLTTGEWHALANDILQALRFQQTPTPGYTDRLLGFWHDKNLDPTLRDYALQQLREWVADSDSRTVHEERPEKIELIRRTFLDAATPGHPSCNVQSTTTGTALLALNEWASAGQIDAAQLKELLLAHAANKSAHRGVRATALQICARRQIPEVVPLAREIAGDGSCELILRMAAIALLGTIGSPEDLALLGEIQRKNTRDPLLQSSLNKALQKLTPKHPKQ